MDSRADFIDRGVTSGVWRSTLLACSGAHHLVREGCAPHRIEMDTGLRVKHIISPCWPDMGIGGMSWLAFETIANMSSDCLRFISYS